MSNMNKLALQRTFRGGKRWDFRVMGLVITLSVVHEICLLYSNSRRSQMSDTIALVT